MFWRVARRFSLFSLAASVFFSSNIARAAEPEKIEIYESYGTYTLASPPAEMQPIVLRVPAAFVSDGSKVGKRNWGVNLLTYYPTFSSPKDPANADFGLRCVGICNGRVLISVGNRTHNISQTIPSMGDFIARAQFKWLKMPPYPPNVRVRDIDPVEGFDEGFERATFEVSDVVQEKPAQIERVYLHRASDRSYYDLTATCVVNNYAATCVLHFSLRCNPAVYVTVNGLAGSYLGRAADIREKTDLFISRMVAEPSCIS